MHKYNNYFPDDATAESLTQEREKMLQSILGRVGAGAFIEPPLNIDYGCNVSVGENFYANFKCVLSLCLYLPCTSPSIDRPSPNRS